ncbi:DAK2 domain-containing protein [Nocardia sp. NPDC019395]|uniref:DAK2 domain-containing protein n=1 Tax=Nocardia sp. NPDC019395 TaxID=3154686 RepID=UPI0033E88A81
MTRNEVAVPETRQVSGVPDERCPGSGGTLAADDGASRVRGADSYRAGLGGAEFLHWGRACVRALERARGEIDGLNVFPVPDSDTGRNLLATMRAAVASAEEIAGEPADGADAPEWRVPRIAAAMARGATAGARGNSGIILSQVLRGFAEAAAETALTGDTYRIALARAAALVRGSLSEPVEGTILTVLDRASAAAANCSESGLGGVARAAAEGAARALDSTRDQLDALREAGVVDAGARGLLVLLDTMVAEVTGETPVRREYPAAGVPRTGPRRFPPEPVRFEVMFRITGADDDRATALRSRLAPLGDSVVVAADGAGGWAVHIHCADAGAAVEAGVAAGSVRDIRIECLSGAHPDTGAAAGAEAAAAGGAGNGVPADAGDRRVPAIGGADRGVLAVAAGAGAAELFEAAGAVVLGAEPALESAALLAAIRQMPHREVLVLPNGALPAHELVAVGAAARDAHRDVLLLPSASMVQGLAAMAVHDRARIAVDDAFAMSEAAAGTRWGALRRARERALTMVGTCAPGDGLGLVGHDVVVIDRDTRAAGHTLLNRMLGLGGELVTLLAGAGAPEELAAELARHIGAEFPGVEVTVYSGGQRADLIQIGVE